jgi:hypothetical protein
MSFFMRAVVCNLFLETFFPAIHRFGFLGDDRSWFCDGFVVGLSL